MRVHKLSNDLRSYLVKFESSLKAQLVHARDEVRSGVINDEQYQILVEEMKFRLARNIKPLRPSVLGESFRGR